LRYVSRQTYRQTDRQTDRQTCRHADHNALHLSLREVIMMSCVQVWYEIMRQLGLVVAQWSSSTGDRLRQKMSTTGRSAVTLCGWNESQESFIPLVDKRVGGK